MRNCFFWLVGDFWFQGDGRARGIRFFSFREDGQNSEFWFAANIMMKLFWCVGKSLYCGLWLDWCDTKLLLKSRDLGLGQQR